MRRIDFTVLTDFSHLRAEIAFRQSWKIQAESLFEANLRHMTESKTIENKLYDKTPNPYRDWETDRKSTRLNSSHITRSRMPSSA